MKRQPVFFGLTLMAMAFLLVAALLQAASGIGLQMDRWFLKMSIGAVAVLAIGLMMIRFMLQLAMEKKIKNPTVLFNLRRFLMVVFSLFYVLKPFLKKSYVTLESDFVALNNQLITDLDLQFEPSEILILTPHCLQSSRCTIKVTGSTDACEMCGQCRVGDLKAIKASTGVDVVIATGGTLARKTIADRHPRLILAVACERDLVSGIMDTRRVLTYGIVNQRPNGPCLDTTVQIEAIQEALSHFIVKL